MICKRFLHVWLQRVPGWWRWVPLRSWDFGVSCAVVDIVHAHHWHVTRDMSAVGLDHDTHSPAPCAESTSVDLIISSSISSTFMVALSPNSQMTPNWVQLLDWTWILWKFKALSLVFLLIFQRQFVCYSKTISKIVSIIEILLKSNFLNYFYYWCSIEIKEFKLFLLFSIFKENISVAKW